MLRSERSTLRRFLALYAFLTLALVLLVSVFYYRSEERIMLLRRKAQVADYAADQIKRLRRLHEHFPRERTYPRDPRFRSAIYDLEHVQIFSTMRNNVVDFRRDIYRHDGVIHFVKLLDSYYLGAKYLFIEIPDDRTWFWTTLGKTALGAGVALFFLALAGLYLARLFLSPMRRSIELLDRFIKDTTHELNTPLMTILANVEGLDPSALDARQRKKLERIDLAARTVSTLYDDLKYVTLESERPARDTEFNLKELIEERILFFETMFRAKNLELHTDLRPVVMHADRRLIARLVDNLLSNAVKYNRRGGSIEITLRPGELSIRDSGRGIPPEALREIFDRYARFDESEGGFGLGLDIVRRIAQRYGLKLSLDSEPGKGTEVRVMWKDVES
ncbi:sensor histidine kinase [Nitratifractor sp.]